MNKVPIYLFVISIVFLLCSCEKFLDEKSDVALTIPDNIEDLDALMNNLAKFSDDPRGGEISTDDYYVSEDDFDGLFSEDEKNLYLWNENVYLEDQSNDWIIVYNAIYYCNLVLEKLEDLKKSGISVNPDRFDKVRGEALYYRGKSYFNAAQIWCQAYDETTSSVDLGLPLRLSSNFNERSTRDNLENTYQRILRDLEESASLLPAQSLHPTKTSKAAAYGMLSRTLLSMRRYEEAGRYADSCLLIYDKLLDFNTLNPTSATPIPQFSDEVILEGVTSATILTESRLRVDEKLIGLFDEADLRKHINFSKRSDGSYLFKGTLVPYMHFTGIASNEMYLNRAEAYCRSGNLSSALDDIDKLRSHRYHVNDYIPWDRDLSQFALLDKILDERRKELLYRGIRWMDVKRLNKEGRGILMSRGSKGEADELQPNDPRYALPLPRTIIELTGMPQNSR
ncbi:RagB/SusD family nutrient uptake outer membrane protein [Sphingobacterium olei]|uniref:RagB/SusD family nutrient uptake outer membrane protein n=1 Tax=Sphingobacterium olei TaxID=2571155 RepID=A0A4U0N7Z8_9SPHI|nr:RagB/SusD family nutrient uptake outer membrane protein [Sphingobacterium olei]TJZ49905.1 RagB/SusD family nutrient uptake outer membrane protein [Sphingobacterium olei]